MKKLMLAAVAALALCSVSGAQASNVLYYGGDFNPADQNANGLANEVDAIVNGAADYDNFTVTGATWHVTGLFTNNLMNGLDVTSANWEIRTGVSEGNGGTVVYSGTAAASVSATGRSGFGYTEYNVEVPVSLNLAAGTYWMMVQPVSGDAGRSFESNTFGDNSVGVHTVNQDYFNSAFFGANFTNANNQGIFQTFSSGVIGTAGAAPEPAIWAMLLLGFGLTGCAMRTRRQTAFSAI